MERLKKTLDTVVKKAITEGVFPCAAVGVSQGYGKKRKVFRCAYGKTSLYPGKKVLTKEFFFDLASLTKPLATTLAILCLMKQGKISLQSKLSQLLPNSTISPDKRDIALHHLLGHTSGLPDYRPYFKKLIKYPENERVAKLSEYILKEPLATKPGEKAVYSDIGFMLLGQLVERISGKRLDDFVRESIYAPLGLGSTVFFNPLHHKRTDVEFVATEKCPWRKKVLVGEVHDDNAWTVNGVAGHAGLFGDIKSVLEICIALLDQWHGRSEHPYYTNKDLKKCFVKQREDSCWGLGFDTPSKQGSSSGRFFSEKSFGHLGFTGTSFWVDPEKDLVVILLTNRVHPNRDNHKIKEFRPLFHDAVIKSLRLACVKFSL
jgi:CubicO group peptidase (beta-lactamase class C family)